MDINFNSNRPNIKTSIEQAKGKLTNGQLNNYPPLQAFGKADKDAFIHFGGWDNNVCKRNQPWPQKAA
jgi:hypothetical protein